MANYKVPARIVAVESFPTTPSGNGDKIQKNRLREMARVAVEAATDATKP
jgi:fatty-acyl-CoA synthase